MMNTFAIVAPAQARTQRFTTSPATFAYAGIQRFCWGLDSRLRGNDDRGGAV